MSLMKMDLGIASPLRGRLQLAFIFFDLIWYFWKSVLEKNWGEKKEKWREGKIGFKYIWLKAAWVLVVNILVYFRNQKETGF